MQGFGTRVSVLAALFDSLRVALCAFPVCLCPTSKETPRIGYLTVGSPETTPARYEAFRQGLREVGYTEGKDIIIEDRYAEEKLDRLPHFAAELVALKVDLIVSGGPTPTSAAKQATKTIPIV